MALSKPVLNTLKQASLVIVGQPLQHQDHIKRIIDKHLLESLGSGGTIPTVVVPSWDDGGLRSSGELPDVFGTPLRLKVHKEEDLDGALGDLFGWAARTKKDPAPVVQPDIERDDVAHLGADATKTPICLGSLGSAETRSSLRMASGFAGIPYLETDLSVGTTLCASPEVGLHSLLEAFHIKSLQSTAQSILTRVRESYGVPLLLRRDDEKLRLTNLWHWLVFGKDHNPFAQPDGESACADLLERRGLHAEAMALRRLVKLWISQDLWRGDRVPEMVLHDKAHSQSVDRIIASLCEPLSPEKISDADLVVLACAAWLHDWGCTASAAFGSSSDPGSYLTDPRDIRKFHGSLSQERLRSDHSKHLLDDAQGFKNTDLYKTIRESGTLAQQVGLISAHHQGWTSSDGRDPEHQKVWDTSVCRPRYDAPRNDITGLNVRSFDGEFDCTNAKDTAKVAAYKRLAVLRVADALDIGWHRIPNFATQRKDRAYMTASYLAGQKHILDKMAAAVMTTAESDSLVRRHQSQLTAVLEKPFEHVTRAFESMVGLSEYPEEEADLKRDWLKHLKLPWLEIIFNDLGKDDSELDNSSFLEWLKDECNLDFPKANARESGFFQSVVDTSFLVVCQAAHYTFHVLTQIYFFTEQRKVRSLTIIPMAHGDKFRLVTHVIAGQDETGSELGQDDRKRVEESVRALFWRELGWKVDFGGRSDPEDPRKDPIRRYLVDRLRIADLPPDAPSYEKAADTLPVSFFTNDQWTRPGPLLKGTGLDALLPITGIPDGWQKWNVAYVEDAGSTDVMLSSSPLIPCPDKSLKAWVVPGETSVAVQGENSEVLSQVLDSAKDKCVGLWEWDRCWVAAVQPMVASEPRHLSIKHFPPKEGGPWQCDPQGAVMRAYPLLHEHKSPSDFPFDVLLLLSSGKIFLVKEFSQPGTDTATSRTCGPETFGLPTHAVCVDVTFYAGKQWVAWIPSQGKVPLDTVSAKCLGASEPVSFTDQLPAGHKPVRVCFSADQSRGLTLVIESRILDGYSKPSDISLQTWLVQGPESATERISK